MDIFSLLIKLKEEGKIGRKTINETASSLEKHGFLSNKEEL